MLNLIDEIQLHTGWGRVYQSGELASMDWENEGLILSASGNLNFRGPCLWFYMEDDDATILTVKSWGTGPGTQAGAQADAQV